MKRNTIFVKALCSLLVICGLFLSGCKQNNKDHNMATKDDFMREAIALSIENVKNGGGPFGAVIVKDGEIIARGVNRVTASNDPTQTPDRPGHPFLHRMGPSAHQSRTQPNVPECWPCFEVVSEETAKQNSPGPAPAFL